MWGGFVVYLRPFYEVTRSRLNLAGLLPSQDWIGPQEAFWGNHQRPGLTVERWGRGRRLLGTRGDMSATGPPHAQQLHAALLPSPNYCPGMGRGWIRPTTSIGSLGSVSAYPCGEASHWPACRPARFRCSHWLPMPDPRRGRRGGPQDWWSGRCVPTMAAPVQPAASWAPSGVPSPVPAIRAAIASALCVRPGATRPRPPSPLR